MKKTILMKIITWCLVLVMLITTSAVPFSQIHASEIQEAAAENTTEEDASDKKEKEPEEESPTESQEESEEETNKESEKESEEETAVESEKKSQEEISKESEKESEEETAVESEKKSQEEDTEASEDESMSNETEDSEENSLEKDSRDSKEKNDPDARQTSEEDARENSTDTQIDTEETNETTESEEKTHKIRFSKSDHISFYIENRKLEDEIFETEEESLTFVVASEDGYAIGEVLSGDLSLKPDKVNYAQIDGSDEKVIIKAAYTLSDLGSNPVIRAHAIQISEDYKDGQARYQGPDYTVSVSWTKEARIPKDAYLKVEEIPEGSGEYLKLLNQANEKLGTDSAEESRTKARFFDIKIMAEKETEEGKGKEEEIQPAAPVSVKISYEKPVETANPDQATVLHYEEDGDVKKIDSDKKTDDKDDKKVEAVNFEAEGFSVYGFIYTVDFTYKNYDYSMAGESSVLLSALFKELEITDKASDAVSVEFTDSSLLEVKQQEGDWLLTSLAPFDTEETLTVTMNSGIVYLITVTDDTAGDPIDISEALESVKITIDGKQVDADGSLNLETGTQYQVELAFRETDNCQFSDDDTEMYYQLPAGMDFVEADGTFTMDLGSLGSLENNTYRFENNKVYIHWNTSDTDHMAILRMADQAYFSFDVQGKAIQGQDRIAWSDEINTEVTVEDAHELTIKKTGSYDAETDKINYKITVDSKGRNTEIQMRDTLKGTALNMDVMDPQDISITLRKADGSSTTDVNYTLYVNKDEKIFALKLPDMADGDHYDIEYTASLDYSKLSKSGEPVYNELANEVQISSEEGGDPVTAYSYNYKIDYASLDKSVAKMSDVIEDETGKYRMVTYIIHSNQKRKKKVSKIFDRINNASRGVMTMAGNGITVVVTKGNGNTETRNMTWGEDSDQGKLVLDDKYSWSYYPPESDGIASYVITYQGRVDMTNIVTTTKVKNTVGDEHGTYEHSQGIPPADGNEVELEKSVKKTTAEEVEWSVDLTVPVNGLKGFLLQEYLPHMYFGTKVLSDTLVAGSIKVTGLLENENYHVNEEMINGTGTGVYNFTFDYTKDGEKYNGLQGGNSPRIITITLKTKNNDEWMTKAQEADSTLLTAQGHTNKVRIGDLEVTAKAYPARKTVRKKYQNTQTDKTSDNKDFVRYNYYFDLDGVDSEHNEIIETFDTDVFDMPESFTYSNGLVNNNAQILYYDVPGTSKIVSGICATITPTDTGARITTTELPKKEDGSLYKYYRISYYLHMKDPAKAEEKAMANGGSIKFTNTASYDKSSSSAEFNYGSPVVKKEAVTKGDKVNFSITINPEKKTLNNGNAMKLTDTFSDTLSVDYSTIKISTDPENSSKSITYDYEGNTGTFKNIPDATKVVLTYTAKVVGTGKINVWNKAVLNDDYKDDYNDWVNISTEGQGGATVFAIYLLKYAADNMQAGSLAGAKFQILDSELNPITYTNKLNPASGNSGKIGDPITFTTGSNGKIMIALSRYDHGVTLKKDTVYYLKEIEAPQGMQLDTSLYSFTVSDDIDQSDPNHKSETREDGVRVYYVGDILKISNSEDSQQLTLAKHFAGNTSLTDAQKKKISFQVIKVDEKGKEITGDNAFKKTIKYEDLTDGKYTITPETEDDNKNKSFGTAYYKVIEKNASRAALGLADNVAATTTYSVNSNGTTVTESNLTTTDSVTGKNLAQVISDKSTNVLFTNKYSTGAYYFNKVEAGTEQPLKDAVFTVYKADNDDAVTTYTTGADGKFSIKRADKTLDLLKTNVLYYVTETKAPEGFVIPDPAPKYYFYFGSEGKDAPAGAADHNAVNLYKGNAEETVINAPVTALTVMKDWKDGNDSRLSDEDLQSLSAIVTLKRAKSQKQTDSSYSDPVEDPDFSEQVTLDYSNNFTKLWDNLEKTDDQGNVYKYYVTEDPLNDFTVSYSNNDGIEEGLITVTNTRIPRTGSLQISKSTKPAGSKKEFTFKLALTAPEGKKLSTSYPAVHTGDESIETVNVADLESKGINLADGQTLTISGLPEGTGYAVTEESEAGWKKTGEVYSNDSKTISKDVTDKVVFTNNYEASGSIVLGGSKTLLGDKTLKKGMFHFTLTEVSKPDSSGKTTAVKNGISMETENAEDGSFSFDKLSYSLADVGEHYYRITEQAGEDKGISYDTTEYLVTVTVEDKNQNGKLTVTADKNLSDISFVNTYQSAGQASLYARKTLTGRDLKEGMFTFALKDSDGNILQTKTNNTGGIAAFDPITYKEAGEYTYTISEVLPDDVDADQPVKDGITYDTSIQKVTVKAEDDGKGNLVISYDGKTSFAGASFTNSYKAEGEILFSGTKTLENADLEEDQFTFEVVDKDTDEVIQSVTNDGDGTIKFKKIHYGQDDVGTHTYTVREVDPDDDILCKTEAYTVTVTVADNGDGTLQVTASENASSLDFVNEKETETEDEDEDEDVVDEEDSEEEDKESSSSKTGDSNNISGYLLLATMALGSALILWIRRRKDIS